MQSFLQHRELRKRVLQRYSTTHPQNISPLAQTSSSSVSTQVERTSSGSGTNNGEIKTELEKPAIQRAAGSSITLVEFDDGNDPANPHNWTFSCKVRCTCVVTMIGFIVSWAGSIESSASTRAARDFGVSGMVESFATGLFLIAFGMGSLFAGPVSETFGRNPVYITCLFVFMVFTMASALAPNIASQLLFRFIAGFFASAPMTCAGGSLSDLWTVDERTYSVPAFMIIVIWGSLLAPVVGGWMVQNDSLSWRWIDWLTLILTGVIFVFTVLFQPESYAPVLLVWKAKHIRTISGDESYKADVEVNQASLMRRFRQAIWRPFTLLVTEPILMLVAIYLIFVTVVLYSSLNGFGFVFSDTYGFSEGWTGTVFLAIGFGLCIPGVALPLFNKWTKHIVAKRIAQGESEEMPPELRLLLAMVASPSLVISLFWMGWTNYPNISPWSDIGAAVLFGVGLLGIWLSFYAYVIDSYEKYAASGLASVTMLRYAIAGIMVPVALPMYENLGVHWTLSLMGFMSLVLCPVPFVFYRYGAAIRGRSKTARGSLGSLQA